MEEPFVLIGENGDEHACELLDVFELGGLEYVMVMAPKDRLVILRLSEREGRTICSVIEDEAEYQRVVAHVEELARQAPAPAS